MKYLLLTSLLLAPMSHAFNITTSEPIEPLNPACNKLGEAFDKIDKPINTHRLIIYWELWWHHSITQTQANELIQLYDECYQPTPPTKVTE